MSLLEVRDLTVTYAGGAAAVRGVDLRLDAARKLGIAGESGCGKSTLALALLRLLPAATRVGGEILLDGEDVLAMKWGRVRAVRWAGASIVFQGAMHSLNPVTASATRSPSRSCCTAGRRRPGRGSGPGSCWNRSVFRRPAPRRIRTSCPAASGSG
ncbi:hypothetical protein SALBM217S_06820 [Streptomyces griseoloalbus]|uniref:ABC transporter domain-containing protein n=1 Tax=Streptomyces pseudogriseolus TaxID=36817 RepID=A0ABQ2TKC9_STREZ|nr:hypothetical protein GCM10010285_60460 [Streptomyces rubiginosus]